AATTARGTRLVVDIAQQCDRPAGVGRVEIRHENPFVAGRCRSRNVALDRLAVRTQAEQYRAFGRVQPRGYPERVAGNEHVAVSIRHRKGAGEGRRLEAVSAEIDLQDAG